MSNHLILVQDVVAEATVIHHIVYSRIVRHTLLQNLKILDFGDDKCRNCFAKLRKAFNSGIDLDSPETIARIHQSKTMMSVLDQATNTPWAMAMNTVQTNAVRRSVQVSAHKALQIASDLLEDPESAIREVQKIASISSVGMQVPPTPKELVQEASKKHDVSMNVPWGIRGFEMIALEPGSIHVIGSRPRVGKTSFALSAGWEQAKKGFPVGVISIEMTPKELTQRQLSSISGISYEDLWVRRVLSQPQEQKLIAAKEMASAGNLYFDGGRMMDMSNISATCRHWVEMYGVRCIWIDYVQNIRSNRQKMRDKMLEVTEELKNLAQELKIPIMECSMLNREAENTVPKINHLMESGAIEQWAHSIVLLDRPDTNTPFIEKRGYKNPDGSELDTQGKCVCLVAKNRNGKSSIIVLDYDGPTMTFRYHQRPFNGDEYNDLFKQ